MSGRDLSPNQEYMLSRRHSQPHIRESHPDVQFITASTTIVNGHHAQPRGHLVLNNFITTTSTDKYVAGLHHHHHHHQYINHRQVNQLDEDSSGESEGESRNTHSNFLYVYFFFSYYLCLTPFRLKKVNSPAIRDNPRFEIHEYLPQKILCGIANILALVRYAVELRRCVQEIKRENPISFFKLFEACSSLVFKTVILRCFWRNKGKFLHVVRFLESPLILPFNKFKFESIFTISALCTFYVVIGFARMITGSGFVRSSDLNLSWWARRLVAEGRYSFFLTNQSHFDVAPPHNEISSLDTVLAIITAFTFQCRFIAGYFVDVGILLCVLSLWAPVAGFASSIDKRLRKRLLEDSSTSNYLLGRRESETTLNKMSPSHEMEYVQVEINRQEGVLQQYKALKMLAGLISEANGTTILPFISEAIFGYAIFFEDVLITKDFFHRIILICFYFCAVNILVFSADVCRKMQCMKTWLWNEDRFSTFPSQRLMLVLHDLSTNAVGITASGIFTIDFYLVGSMISVLITLFIIRLQYQTLDG